MKIFFLSFYINNEILIAIGQKTEKKMSYAVFIHVRQNTLQLQKPF